MGRVRVAAAVILRPDGQVLLAERPRGKAYAGYWEFPGGKLEPGETAREALVRELYEELGLLVRDAAPWLVRCHVYPHADVELNFFRVFAWEGEPVGRDGQAFRWQVPGQIDAGPLLPANTAVLRALELPTVYGIATVPGTGTRAPIDRIRRALDGGLRMIGVRGGGATRDAQRYLADALLAVAAPYRARIVLDGDEADAQAWGCAGVRWDAARLARATARPPRLLCGASCRGAADVARAGALGLDFAVLGPVLSATSRSAAAPLGWQGLERQVAGATLPVFAQGGLGREDLATAIACGAHGVALLRRAW